MELEWKGTDASTVGGLVTVLSGIVVRYDPVEAAQFLAAYRAQTEHADVNVGYALGYLGHDMMVEGLALFGVEHPFFGGATAAARVTPEQAFEMGQKLGEEMRKGE